MISTGMNSNFGIALVGGVLIGAFAISLARGRFRIEGFGDQRDIFRQLFGAVMMGVGSGTAWGSGAEAVEDA